MRDASPLAGELGLLPDDIKQEAKLKRLLDDLKTKVTSPVDTALAWHFSETPMTPAEALSAEWTSWPAFGPRSVWSKKQGHTWFAGAFTVPQEAHGRILVLRIASQWEERKGSTDPQCLAYLDGRIAQAVDGNHMELDIARSAVAGATHTVHVNAFTFFDRPLVGLAASFHIRDERVERLYYDLLVPYQVATYLPQTDARRHAVLDRVERALRALDRRGGDTAAFRESLPAAEAIAAEIYALPDGGIKPLITAVGHTHIDIAWLWRVAHTRDKAGRSFATALKLMDEYPGFAFMYNQAVLFNFLKQDYPELWARVKEKVRSGQFEVEGAMWVEPDANIVSGESLVRQIMRGRQFHRDEFGVVPKSLWLPDTFGYSANLPQIMCGSGLDYFITSKLSWNDTNRHPYDTFFWRGIDGSTTKAQLITTQALESKTFYTIYNPELTVSEVFGSWRRYEPKSASREVLMCYGYGDGGGGPTRDMIERGSRLERGIPGAPELRLEGIGPFLDRLGERMEARAEKFPTWNGELYLEYHRGTLTTLARNKASNRKAERLMRELEFLSSMAFALKGRAYPEDELRRYWETILINQFHDILPGTSIAEVYQDSDADYGTLFDAIAARDGLWHGALAQVSQSGADELTLVNATGQRRDGELVVLPATAGLEGYGLESAGRVTPLQRLQKADGTAVFAAPATVGPLGWSYARLRASVAAPAKSTLSVSERHLENEHVRVAFDDHGEITSLVDKRSARELIRQGCTANRLIAYEDKPKKYDAWDIDHYFEEQYWPLADGPVAIAVVERGPYRAALRISRTYQSSTLVQIVSLEADASMVRFETLVDWQEQHTVLKACFPLDLNCSEIRSEIQFGHVKRATHRNTSVDKARFEASMHRWIDMSETNFGAAFLNDCKYGYDAVEQLVRLTLLRGSMAPAEMPDRGENRMSYAIMVHGGLTDLSEVQRAAERFNNPVAVVGDASGPSTAPVSGAAFSFAACDAANVTLETVKKAEESQALILRMFEHANIRAEGRIVFGIPVRSVRMTNLMEEQEGRELTLRDNGVDIALRPFEIQTLKIEPA